MGSTISRPVCPGGQNAPSSDWPSPALQRLLSSDASPRSAHPDGRSSSNQRSTGKTAANLSVVPSDSMTASFGEDILSVFDVWEHAQDFLCDVIQSGIAPRLETLRLLDESLLAGAENWHALIDCATSIHQSRTFQLHGLDGQDVLTSIWLVLSGPRRDNAAPVEEPWLETDSLIALAQKLERDASSLPLSVPGHHANGDNIKPPWPQPKRRHQPAGTTSHYWDHAGGVDTCVGLSPCRAAAIRARLPWQNPGAGGSWPSSPRPSGSEPQSMPRRHVEQGTSRNTHGGSQDTNLHVETLVAPWSSRSSPYFSTQSPSRGKGSSKRPPPGTISCISFPPLTCSRFGIIQEEVAHEPFWLLIAVTFLIKTSGQLAIPAFRSVMSRFPTPSQLADPANAQELSDMICHLGLAVVRVAYIQKYATAYLDSPPQPNVRYRVRNYDKRDVGPSLAAMRSRPKMPTDSSIAPEDDGESPEAWEIGHMTQGRYTLDSWRIFCRDRLLGRAQDWNGGGREPEFQPEWMRVMPKDKELRAFLRWMWMREGWEWDPATGERTVLREDMRWAVNQGRVEYDDAGGLRILDEPPKSLTTPG